MKYMVYEEAAEFEVEDRSYEVAWEYDVLAGRQTLTGIEEWLDGGAVRQIPRLSVEWDALLPDALKAIEQTYARREP